ncbi:hypothetical protein ACX0G9_02250 [Flavitalea flava]
MNVSVVRLTRLLLFVIFYSLVVLLCCTVFSFCRSKGQGVGGSWSLMVKRPGKSDVLITRLPEDLSRPFSAKQDIGQLHIEFTLDPTPDYTVFRASATGLGSDSIFFALENNYANEIPYNYNGEVKSAEIFRQGPHDVNAWITERIAKQALPMVAIRTGEGFTVAINGSPSLYDNYTSQAFYPGKKVLALRSGDDGAKPGLSPDMMAPDTASYNKDKTQIMTPGKILAYYHPVNDRKKHVFEGIIFYTQGSTLTDLRKAATLRTASYFSGGRYKDYFGALAFTTAYMNLRTNETGKSSYWVVPSVEYANSQYCRDAFWISMMLPQDKAGECLKSELARVNTYAEYPLMTILWAYRSQKEKMPVNLTQVQAYVDSVEKRARGGYFYSYTEQDGRQDFQYWGDIIAFDKDDVVTYNQGLFALAIEAARQMGLHTQTDPAVAINNYKHLFNAKGGYLPISRKKKDITGPDPVAPDLLSILYFNRPLLSDEVIRQHYRTVVGHLKTAYGYKIIAQPDGRYLKTEQYDVPGYTSQANHGIMPDGQYFKGGSFFLYDNLFLIDAYLHRIKGAEEELTWRVGLDFRIGATTYECLNTTTGEPWKPNMGWNVSIYHIWRKLVDEGKASEHLFTYIDSIVSKK